MGDDKRRNVICVLRSGGDYTPLHVAQLHSRLMETLKGPWLFHVLTDYQWEVRGLIPNESTHVHILKNDWPGWWSKIELFRNWGLQGKVIFIDLDTVPVGDISPMFDVIPRENLVMLQDFYYKDRAASGVLGWDADCPMTAAVLETVYQTFEDAPERHMKANARWGDQRFLDENLPVRPVLWQDLLPKFPLPGMVVSYKVHIRSVDMRTPNQIPEGVRLICFHGKPRPWCVNEPWIK